MKERIARALGSKGAAESDQLRISALAGKVTIIGSVRSWSQHDDATASAPLPGRCLKEEAGGSDSSGMWQ